MVKHLCLEIIEQQQIPPLHRELMKAITSSKRSESQKQRSIPLAKYDGTGLSFKTFQKWENFGRGSERIPIMYAIVTATSKVKLFKSLGAVGYLNTWLPRSIFIYSNNTLLTAGCCKSELRYLKHWYRLLCPGLVKPILGHSGTSFKLDSNEGRKGGFLFPASSSGKGVHL